MIEVLTKAQYNEMLMRDALKELIEARSRMVEAHLGISEAMERTEKVANTLKDMCEQMELEL